MGCISLVLGSEALCSLDNSMWGILDFETFRNQLIETGIYETIRLLILNVEESRSVILPELSFQLMRPFLQSVVQIR